MNLKTAKELSQMTYSVIHNSYTSHLTRLAQITLDAGLNGQFQVNHYIGSMTRSEKILLVEHLKNDYGFEVVPLYSKSILEAEMIIISWSNVES